MKKPINKLSLNKVTISNLNNSELERVIGAVGTKKGCLPNTFTCPSAGCTVWCPTVVCTIK